jgi:hypothetical protein
VEDERVERAFDGQQRAFAAFAAAEYALQVDAVLLDVEIDVVQPCRNQVQVVQVV